MAFERGNDNNPNYRKEIEVATERDAVLLRLSIPRPWQIQAGRINCGRQERSDAKYIEIIESTGLVS